MAAPRRLLHDFWRYRLSFGCGVLFLVVSQALALVVPQLLGSGTDALVRNDLSAVTHAGAELVIIAIMAAGARILSRVLIFNSGRRVEFDIRNDLFRHLTQLAPSFYGRMPLGQVMSRAVNDLSQVRLLLGPGILNITNTTVVYVVALPLLFVANARLAFFALLPFPLLLMFGRVFGKRLYQHSTEAQERMAALSARVQENLTGVMTVRVYARERDEIEAFERLNDRYLESNMQLAKLRGLMFPAMGLAGALALVIVLWLGGLRIGRGEMSVGDFVKFNAYLAALTWPTIALGWMLSLWQRGLASLKRINEIFEADPTIVDGPRIPEPFVGRIKLSELTVSYPGAKDPVLERVSAEFEPGETIVIVGPTGSGKSTLLRALARILEVPAKSIFLDGADVLDLPLEHVRGAIAYAPQEAFLFSRTIYENIAFGRPSSAEADVVAAAESASLERDIASFPEGLDTLVGERGITLSGGQRQRTALARALLVEPRILLLDDALAAVDTETEARIVATLTRHAGRRTTILATHRLSFAAHADRILVFDRGRLVEQGTEAELLALDGMYARMHRRQRLSEALEQVATPPAHAEAQTGATGT